jgi:transposase
MIKIVFSQPEIDELYKAQLINPNPRIRRKLMAVYMKSLDVGHEMICKVCRISWPTLLSYFKEYLLGGINDMTRNRHRGHPSKLNDYEIEIKTLLTDNPPATIKEAKAKIKGLTGIEISIPQVWSFMRKLGFSTRKVCGIPGKADVEVQESFKKKSSSRGSQKR